MKHLLVIFFTLSFAFCFSQQLVIPGDFPDPSVIKFGDTYWATATTSNWAPTFPLLSSKDLVRWKLDGYTFDKLPTWADYYFWAPEISYDKGMIFLYYTAHKRGGNLCVGIASARKPEGPYTDHGPIMCQEVGSIDAFAMRDETGKLFLIWKEDGNSVNQPTPIWAIEMNEERTAVIGEKKELFRNEVPWEANLVEGVSMIRRGNFFYAFYSAAGCCGRGCTYGIGVARAKNLLGPWRKFEKNPLLTSTAEWKCPGHGTPVEMNGKFYFLYHAYNTNGDVYTGRQGVLSEFVFTQDGWIQFIPSEKSKMFAPSVIEENFLGDTLAADWQWSVFRDIRSTVDNGALTLQASEENSGAFVAQKTHSTDYEAETTIIPIHTDAEAGIALIGDENNMICASYKSDSIKVWKLEEGKETLISERKIIGDKLSLNLKVRINGVDNVVFSYKTTGKYIALNDPINSFFLPPWDRAVRVALISKGDSSQSASFDSFIIRNK